MLIIIFSLIGIVSIISIWLYGSYNDRLEIVTNEVERSLSSSVQRYYENHETTIHQYQRQNYRSLIESEFINDLITLYPNVDSAEVKGLMDDFWKARHNHYHNLKGKTDSSKYLLPLFVLQQINFDAPALAEIDSLVALSLHEKGILVDVKVIMEQKKDWPRGRRKIFVDSQGMINTRPILVNPHTGNYLNGKFAPPVVYILLKMIWQITIAFLMIIGVIGAFIYLLVTINRQAKSAILRKSFVNNMTHELKTPVSTVVAAIEAVQRYGAKDDKEKMQRYLKISQKELSHLTGLIERVLQLNVDEVNGIVLDRSKVNMILLLTDLIELTQLGAVKEVNFDLQYEEKDSYFIDADLSLLRNVFSNLFDNAIKYSEGKVKVEVRLFKKDNFLFVQVRDFGIGISSNYHKEVFDMFFRVPHGDLHPVKGSGLGLAYVKQVVEQHGGTISLKSDVGQGAIFTIILPVEL